MIEIRDLTFEYFDRDEEGNLTDMINAIRGINFDAEKGEIIAIAGRNGSGKSTFAKILNRLLAAIEGTVIIDGIDATDSDNTLEIRKRVGMVFQNPDEQLVGSIIEEDVAFGAENIGVPSRELRQRVDEAIIQAGLVDADNLQVIKAHRNTDKNEDVKKDHVTNNSIKNNSINTLNNTAVQDNIAGCIVGNGKNLREVCRKRINDLSGGEKQKVSIAGVLAMKPKCIVLDEATSMLDPTSRKQILDTMCELRDRYGMTIIMITHIMEELLLADTIYVFDKGRIVLKGDRDRIFSDREILQSMGLELPVVVDIANALYQKGVVNTRRLYNIDDIVSCIRACHPHSFMIDKSVPEIRTKAVKVHPTKAILMNNVSFGYGKKQVLKDVSLTISKGDYVAVVGETGAGKTTLLQMIPALLKPAKGEVYVDGMDVWDRTTDKKKLRCKIGYLFQYPEQQLFGKNVYEDVVFGPRNVGINEIQAESRAYEAIKLVGLPQSCYDTPLDKLSGGQRRRVALAGVLAMKPEYLILDEPTAGLDPEGRDNMLDIIDALHREAGITVILITHDADFVARRANRVIALDKGKVLCDQSPIEAFASLYEAHKEMNEKEARVKLPCIMQLMLTLAEAGLELPYLTLDEDEGVELIRRAMYD